MSPGSASAAPASSRGNQKDANSFNEQHARIDNRELAHEKGLRWYAFDGLDQVAGDVTTLLRRNGPGQRAEEAPYFRAHALQQLIKAIYTAAPELKKALQHNFPGLAVRVSQRLRATTAEQGRSPSTATANCNQTSTTTAAAAAPTAAAARGLASPHLRRADSAGLATALACMATGVSYLSVRVAAYLSPDSLADGIHWQAYSAAVLAAETLSILSLCLSLGTTATRVTGARERRFARLPRSAGAPGGSLRHKYTVRVLVLCCGESGGRASAAAVRHTVASAHAAAHPEGCAVRVYVVDEEGDECTRGGVEGGEDGTTATYVALPDELKAAHATVMNSRAEVLNFALSMIYEDAGGSAAISTSELVSVMRAGETWAPSHLANLLPHIDGADNAACVICPRTSGTDCDVFGAPPAARSEHAPHGMSAHDSSATMMHSSMVVRARPLADVGWFPPHTVAETWELRMRLESAGWTNQFAPECSVAGEAPGAVCEALAAHHRVARGRFQTFWSPRCPLLLPGLTALQRAAYTSDCLQPFASGVWTILFTLVPLVHLIAGVFPLVFTAPVAATMAAHYLLRAALLLLGAHSLEHTRALWLARIAASIHAWGNLTAAVLAPIDATLGAHPNTFPPRRTPSRARAPAALLWALVVLPVSAVAFAGGCMRARAAIDLPTGLSLCAVMVNAAPPLLLVARAGYGRGPKLTRTCTLVLAACAAAAAVALGFIPLLFPRNVNFERAARLSIRFLSAERSGRIPPNFPVGWRSDSGLQYSAVNFAFTNVMRGVVADVTTTVNEQADLSGGFYNEGEVGPVKLTWNVAATTSMLAWALLEYPDVWEASPQLRAEATAVLTHGARYMQEVYVITPLSKPPNPNSLMSSKNDQLVYVVGWVQRERKDWRRPEDVTEFEGLNVDVGVLGLDESPSDLAGQVSAAITAGALALRKYDVVDRATASSMVDKAHRLFQSAMFSPGLYQEAFNGTIAELGIKETYPSNSFSGDLFWASTWLFRASAAGFRTANATYYEQAMSTTMELAYSELSMPGTSWDDMSNIAVTHAATISRDVRYHLEVQSFLWDWICDGDLVQYTRNGRAFFEGTPHLGATAAAAAMAAVYVHSERNSKYLADDLAMTRGLQCFAGDQARYLLGGQVTALFPSKPFMIGYSNRSYTRTFHRGASCPAAGAGKCSVSVAIQDAPDVNSIDGALLWNPTTQDFPQDARGRNTTVVSLENNFAVPLLFAAVHTQAVQHSRCLNRRGTAFMQARICRNGRPSKFRLGPQESLGRVTNTFQGLYQPKQNPDDRMPPPPPPADSPLVPTIREPLGSSGGATPAPPPPPPPFVAPLIEPAESPAWSLPPPPRFLGTGLPAAAPAAGMPVPPPPKLAGTAALSPLLAPAEGSGEGLDQLTVAPDSTPPPPPPPFVGTGQPSTG